MQGNRKMVFLICIVALLVRFAMVAVGASPKKTPLEKIVAGYSIEKSDQVAVHDPRSGYYLIRTGLCDGAHRHIALCLDLKALQEWGFSEKSAMRSDPLPGLQTSRGVHIGDTITRVQQIMGRPTWQGNSKYTPGESVWTYHCLLGTQEDGIEYTTLFRLRKGRVTGIELTRDDLGAE